MIVIAGLSAQLSAQPSPPAETSVSIAGKMIRIKYAAPSVRGRKIFGDNGLLSKDPHYPVWRAGANDATAFHTETDIQVGGMVVPKGDYTLFVNVADPDKWDLIISKDTGEWGLSYDSSKNLGAVKMTMSKPSSPIEKYKMTLSSASANSGKLQLEWEDHVAFVPITVK